MNLKLTPGRIHGAAIVALSVWVVHGFLQGLLAACVIATASWPLYARFAARVESRIGRSATSMIFTALMTVFVLAPMVFAFWALLSEAHAVLVEIAAADRRGTAVPPWLTTVPLVGPWAAERWQSELAHPGALLAWMQRTDPSAILGVAQSLGGFTARHALIIGVTILLLCFLYQEGESLGQNLSQALRHHLGERAERHVEIAKRAVRASVNSMLVVGLFSGFAAGVVYAIAGAPRAAVWGAITGSLAAVPFLGYVAVAAVAAQMAMKGAATPALVVLALGCFVLFCSDKIVRPMAARDGIPLHFVWVLLGCLGGFEVLGLVGLVVGPVVLALVGELWRQRVRSPVWP
ncbi:MAG TPA: AI-2E family transporter [Burkholderiaceae bacterium]|nr:AI-2E family transporter [Burkholderiaceae bacterium]